MIEVENLNFYYSRKQMVYNNLNLIIGEGTVAALLGMNGAGKTTLLNLIAGFLIPKGGNCKVQKYESSKRAPEMLQDLFMVSDISEFPSTTVDKFCRMYSDFYPKFDDKLFHHCLTEFSLSSEQSLKRISHGEKRKVMLSFALATRCKVLLFDEPTNGLDIPSKASFRKLIASSTDENQTILLATHQVRDLANIVDRVIIEHHGEIVLNETTDRISEKLLFCTQADQFNPEDLIFSQKGIVSNEFVAVNRNGHSGILDIELLFNAAVSNPIELSSVFNAN